MRVDIEYHDRSITVIPDSNLIGIEINECVFFNRYEGTSMLLLAKAAGILVLVWFYLSGKKLGEPPVKWAIIGLVGYWISWWLANKLILSSLTGMFTKSSAAVFLVTQIPVVVALAAVLFIRKKLVSDAGTAQLTSESKD